MKLIEAYDNAITGLDTFADSIRDRANSLVDGETTERQILSIITAEIVDAVKGGTASHDGTKTGIGWTTIARAMVLAEFAWKDIQGGIRDAFEVAFPKMKWSGGFLSAVSAPDKPTRKSKGATVKSVGSAVDKAIAAVESVKGPKRGKEWTDARAKVILLAKAVGLTVS